MKKLSIVLAVALLMLTLWGCGAKKSTPTTPQSTTVAKQTTENASESSSPKILVVYFSETGNTENIAIMLSEEYGADLYKITPKDEYTEDDLNYNNSDCRANKEQNDKNSRPEINGKVENMENYDIVLIGHPIWWGEEPRIIDTFMESYDFSDKTVAEFCTSGGSGIESAEKNIKSVLPDSVNWAGSKRFDSGASRTEIQNWIKELNLIK